MILIFSGSEDLKIMEMASHSSSNEMKPEPAASKYLKLDSTKLWGSQAYIRKLSEPFK